MGTITKPAYWWYQLRDEDDNVLDAEVEWVNLDKRGVATLQVYPPRPVGSPEIVMIAEVPSPEICAALALSEKPTANVLEALGDLIREENSHAFAADSERVAYWVDSLIAEIRTMKGGAA